MAPHRTLPRPPDDTDARLVAAAVACDDGAFCALADRHRAVLHAHCRRVLHSTPDAEDAVQEALLRAWRRRSTFEARSSFGWWLRCIATNVCIDIARRRARSSAVMRRIDSDTPGGEPPGEGGSIDPACLITAKEAVEQAYLVAIRILPPRQRSVLVLREVLRYSAADTAELLGDTVASVNSALQRARATLDRHQHLAPATAPAPLAAPAEQRLVRQLVQAHERADVAAAVVATLTPSAATRDAGRAPARRTTAGRPSRPA